MYCFFFFFSSRRRHTRCSRDWSSDVCSSDLAEQGGARWSSEARSRLGLYAHVPGVGGFAHHVLAVRLAAGATGGPLGGLFKAGGGGAGAPGLPVRPAPGAARGFSGGGVCGGRRRGGGARA